MNIILEHAPTKPKTVSKIQGIQKTVEELVKETIPVKELN